MSGIDAWAREILRCPACGAALSDAAGPSGSPTLACDAPEHHTYPVREGIPVLLLDEMVTGPVGE